VGCAGKGQHSSISAPCSHTASPASTPACPAPQEFLIREKKKREEREAEKAAKAAKAAEKAAAASAEKASA
jgi:hypothetical protein